MGYRRNSDRLTEDERAKVRELRKSGVSVAALADRFRMTAPSIRLLCNETRLCVDCGEPLHSLNHQRKRHADCKPVRCECGNPVMAKNSAICSDCHNLASTIAKALKPVHAVKHHGSSHKHISQSVFLRHDPIAAAYQWRQAVTR